jgi:hypothetical protein
MISMFDVGCSMFDLNGLQNVNRNAGCFASLAMTIAPLREKGEEGAAFGKSQTPLPPFILSAIVVIANPDEVGMKQPPGTFLCYQAHWIIPTKSGFAMTTIADKNIKKIYHLLIINRLIYV